MARFAIVTSKGKKGEHLTRFKDPFPQVGDVAQRFIWSSRDPLAVLANDQTRPGRKPERNWIFGIRDA
jgi:hypothetical protein